MPKATTPTSVRHGRRHNPLEDDMLATGILKSRPSKSKKHENEDQAQFVESKASKQILKLGRELAQEEQQEADAAAPVRVGFEEGAARSLDFEDDDDIEEDAFEDVDETFGDDQDQQGDSREEIEVDDLETFNRFLPSGEENPLSGWLADRKNEEPAAQQKGSGVNLADLILAKIAEKEAADKFMADPTAAPIEEDYELPPRVVEAFTKYGPWHLSCLGQSRLTNCF